MFKRKLFKRALSKRVLPVILSVAMVFQSAPATALAAEDQTAVVTEAEDTADETTADESAEPAGEEPEQSGTPQDEDADVPSSSEGSSEPASETASSPEDTGESATDAASEPESTGASVSDAEGTGAPASEDGQEETTTEEQQEAAAEAAELDTVIRIKESLKDCLTGSYYFKEVSADSYAVTYTGETLNNVKNQLEDLKIGYFSIEIDGVEDDDLSFNLLDGSFSLKWQKVLEDGKTEDIGSPVDAGRYRLVMTLDEVAGVCKAANAVIDVEILPAELKIQDAVWDETIAAGTTVGEYKEQLKQAYVLNDAENNYVDKTVVVVESGIKIVVFDSYSDTKAGLADTDILRSDADYSVYFAEMPLAESMGANYKVAGVGEEFIHRIKVGDLTKTEVVVEQHDPAKEITVVYVADAEALSAALEKAVTDAVKSRKVYVKPDPEDTSGEKTEIALAEGEALTLEWCTKSIKPDYANSNGEYNPLGEGVVPTEAGTYYVRYKFAGREGSYEGSVSDAIKVTVEPVSLILKPDEASKPVLLTGMKGSEVEEALASLTYKLYPYTVDAAGKITLSATPHTEKENFWGVAYNDKNETQYYSPVFELEYREAKTDEKGELLKVDGAVQYNSWMKNNSKPLRASKGSEKAIEYRIVFSGYKAVFGDGNSNDKRVEVTDTTTMEAEKNYLVNADEQIRHLDGELSLVIPVDVETANKVEIDVTDIIDAFKAEHPAAKDADGLTEESPLWKIYDDKALYTKREDYKKAGIKVGDAASSKTTLGENETLSYTWEYKDGGYWRTLSNITYDSDLKDTLSYVGEYRLKVTYTDATHTNQSASKEVYFEVKQQEVMVVGKDFTARVGKDADDLVGSYLVYKLPNNSEEEFAKLSEADRAKAIVSLNELFAYDPDSDRWSSESEFKAEVNELLLPKVQRQEKDDAGNDVPGKYVDMADGEPFVAGYTYRACLYFENPYNHNYTNRDNAATKAAEADEDAESPVYHLSWFDLKLQNIGAEELTVVVDKTKLPASKVYDGEFIDIEEAFNNGLLKVVLKNDHAQEANLTIGSAEEYFASLDDPTVEKKDVYYGLAVVDNTRMRGYAYSGYALDADTYYLGVWFEGNEQYKDFDIVFTDCSFQITPQPITIRPVLTTDTLASGELVRNLYDYAETPFERVKGSIAPRDEKAFTYGSWYDNDGKIRSGYYAFGGALSPSFQYDNAGVGTNGRLRYGKTYEVFFSKSSNGLKGIYAQNYDVTFEKAYYKVEKRGNAGVTSSGFNGVESVRLATAIEQGVSQTIVPVEGIPFAYKCQLPDGKVKAGNFFAVRITAPLEYSNSNQHSEYADNWQNFVYEKDIEKNGGYVIEKFTNSRQYITVLFDVTDLKDLEPTDPKKQKEFSICWEDGYVEKFVFDFSKAVLADNLQEAVAPKSLAFNGINSKMVVGEEQNLDVKITKVQLGDIISIAYETDATDVLSIDKQTGHVTALQAGKTATVTAYAYRLDKDGKEVPLGKPATAKITVMDVTAPAIKKIDEAGDGGAAIHFTPVTNGYRRELYVLAGKAKVTDFDAEIAKLEKGQANNLVKVIYDVERYAKSELDAKGKFVTYKYVLTGLGKEQEYTIYLRNVSAVRTLADGSPVKLSAKGVVKNFKTTKPQVKRLKLYSDDTVATEIDLTGDHKTYEVALDSKKVQMTTDGIYKDYGEFADSNDLITLVLPTKDKTVVNPKLTYEVHDYDDNDKVLSKVASRYAAVSNKGQLTLKGVGLDGFAKVQVKVKADNNVQAVCDVIITAEPTAVTAKNAKVKVGESVVISDYLNYTQGKTKVLNYVSSRLQIVNKEELEEQGIRITESVWRDGYWLPYLLIPTKDGNFEIKIRDLSLEAHTADVNASVTLKLSVGKLDPVKNLKAVYVDDSRITINFAHTGMPSDFLIEVKDGRGSLVSRKLVSRSSREDVSKDDEDYEQEKQRWVVDGLTYFEKTKMYAYTIDRNLVRQSAYQISVTALYDGTEAKAVVAKTKTTNIPASYYNMAACNWWEDGEFAYRPYGGAKIDVTDLSNPVSGSYWSISRYPYLVSGNTYTLNLDANAAAKTRITDTLTWKSSDAKVASVKANAGTYTATLKAVKYGTTTIEVTSKTTKKVIARYMIAVNPVNNGQNYYGDYEEEYFRRVDPLYNGTVEVLTLSNDVRVQKYNATESYTWVAFTAPAFGVYTFECNDYYDSSNSRYFEIYDKTNADSSLSDYSDPTSKFLESGQKIYFKVYGSFTLSASVKEFGKLTVDAPVAAIHGTWLSFVAPEDNYYTFKGVDTNIKVIDNSDLTSANLEYVYDENGYTVGYGRSMKAGESILLKANYEGTVSVEKRNLAKEELSADSKDRSVTLTADVKEQWMKFTAPATAEYTFMITDAEEDEFDFYRNIDAREPERIRVYKQSVTEQARVAGDPGTETVTAPQPKYSVKLTLNEGDVIGLKLFVEAFTDEKPARSITINVSQPKVDPLALGENTVTIPTNANEVWRSFKVEEGYYSLAVEGIDGSNPYVAYYNNSMATLSMNDGKLAVPSDGVKAGDTIYLKVTNGDAKVTITKVEAKAELKAGSPEKVEIDGKDGSKQEYWYTFKAPRTGRYVFRFETDMERNDNNSGTAGNDLNFGRYSKILGDLQYSFDIWNNTREEHLSMGETFTFCLTATDVDENFKLLGYICVDDVDGGTGVTAVKTGDTNPIKLENTVLPNWYVFTADVTGTYTFTWKPAGKSGDVELGLYSDMASGWPGYTVTDSGTTYSMTQGGKVYIKAVQTTATAVDGNLSITAPVKPEKIKDGTLSFSKLASGTTKEYTFTASQSTLYAITKQMGENAEADVSVSGIGSVNPYREESLEKGRTYTVRVTATSDEASGTVTIKPVTVTPLKADENVTANKDGNPSWYVWTVEKAGRYNLLCSANDKMNIEYYDGLGTDNGRIRYTMGSYYETGDKVYIRATTSASDADQTVRFTPNIIMNDLTLSDKESLMTVAKGTVEYYKYTVAEDGVYTITTSSPAENVVWPESVGYAMNTDNEWKNIGNNGLVDLTLSKGEIVYVAIAAYDETDANFNFKLEKRNEIPLTAGKPSEEVTLKAGEEAWFSFEVRENGEFAFKTQGVTPETASLSYDVAEKITSTRRDNGFYFVCEGTFNEKITFSVTNTSSAEAKFKVLAERVRYEELTEAKALENLEVAKGELKWLKFTAPEDGRYTFASSSENNVSLNAFDRGLHAEMPMAKGDTVTMYLTNNTADAVAKTTVSVKSVKAEEITAEPITVDAGASKWVKYTAKEEGEYTFTLQNTTTEEAQDVDMYVYDSILSNSPSSGTEISKLLADGDTVYFKLTNDDPETVQKYTFSVSFVKTWGEKVEIYELEDGWYTDLNEGEVKTVRVYRNTEGETNKYLYEFFAYSNGKTVKVDYRKNGTANWSSLEVGSTRRSLGSAWYADGDYLEIRFTGLADGTYVYLNAKVLEYELKLAYSVWAEIATDTDDFVERTYTYQAPKDGSYSFYVNINQECGDVSEWRAEYKDESGNVLSSVEATFDSEKGYWCMPGYLPDLKTGDVVKVTVFAKANKNDYIRYDVGVNLYTTREITAGSSVSGSAMAGEKIQIRFTPEEAGRYRITLRNTSPNQDSYINGWCRMGEWDCSLGAGEEDSAEFQLSSEKYYIYVNNDYEKAYTDYSYLVTVEKVADYE